jgi:hypothetical protein
LASGLATRPNPDASVIWGLAEERRKIESGDGGTPEENWARAERETAVLRAGAGEA